jgi:hypothetical protein
LSVTPDAAGLRLVADDREVVARVVARLVAEEVPVYGAVPEPPSLEDVYFDIQARLAADPNWQLA